MSFSSFSVLKRSRACELSFSESVESLGNVCGFKRASPKRVDACVYSFTFKRTWLQNLQTDFNIKEKNIKFHWWICASDLNSCADPASANAANSPATYRRETNEKSGKKWTSFNLEHLVLTSDARITKGCRKLRPLFHAVSSLEQVCPTWWKLAVKSSENFALYSEVLLYEVFSETEEMPNDELRLLSFQLRRRDTFKIFKLRLAATHRIGSLS